MNNRVIKNTLLQYLMTIAQYVFPFLTFPYLTRVLRPEGYAIIAYMSSFVVYFQQLIDYGFTLSSTKRIAENQNDSIEIEKIWGATTQAKLILSVLAVVLFFIISFSIDIVSKNILTACLYLCVPLLSIFLPDYLFRGLEDMATITVRYVIAKSISTFLTFIVVKGSEDIFFIPLLSIISSIVSIALTQIQIKRKYHFKMRYVKFYEIVGSIRESTTFFISTAATTAFGAFNTFMMGVMPITATQLGYWGAFYGLISSAQSLYSPIISSIYPYMVRTNDYRMIKKIIKYIMPLVIIMAVITIAFSERIILILCGLDYVPGAQLFRLLVPLLVISFPLLVLNFPVLGAAGYAMDIAKATMRAAVFHITCLIALALSGWFSAENVAITRLMTEIILFCQVVYYIYKKTSFFKKTKLLKIDKAL